MKKVGIVTLILILLLGLGTVAAYARAKKVDLRASTWPTMYDPTGTLVGWVIVNKNAAGEIIVTVHLDAGVANKNAQFYVFIYNTKWTYVDESSRHGDFYVNVRGRGNWHGTISSTDVAYVQVVVRAPAPPGTPRYATRSIANTEIEPPM